GKQSINCPDSWSGQREAADWITASGIPARVQSMISSVVRRRVIAWPRTNARMTSGATCSCIMARILVFKSAGESATWGAAAVGGGAGAWGAAGAGGGAAPAPAFLGAPNRIVMPPRRGSDERAASRPAASGEHAYSSNRTRYQLWPDFTQSGELSLEGQSVV